MPDLFTKSNRQLSAPQFQRSRQRLRGPRESEKMNLEVAQFYYDIERLYERLQEVGVRLASNIAAIEDGTVSLEVYEGGSSTVSLISGMLDIATEISMLEDRVRSLEGY